MCTLINRSISPPIASAAQNRMAGRSIALRADVAHDGSRDRTLPQHAAPEPRAAVVHRVADARAARGPRAAQRCDERAIAVRR